LKVKTIKGGDGEHAYALIFYRKIWYKVDIPYEKYEVGLGYCWKKLPGVVLTADDVIIEPTEYKMEDFCCGVCGEIINDPTWAQFRCHICGGKLNRIKELLHGKEEERAGCMVE
jgi:hypothetical protein